MGEVDTQQNPIADESRSVESFGWSRKVTGD